MPAIFGRHDDTHAGGKQAMMTNNLNLPKPFVDAVTSDYRPTKGRYSVTRTLGSPCEAVLLRRHAHEIDGDVADSVWLIFGSAVHKILEESQETESQIKENFLSVPIDDRYTLSGIFDLYDDSTGTVTDYKTASVWKVKFGDFSDWRRQTLYYCWMLRQIGFSNAGRGEIVALIKDHNRREAGKDPKYPQHPVFVVSWDFSEEELSEAESEIREWFRAVEVAESTPDEQLVPCTPEQRWAKPERWAVRKGRQKRALRVLDSEEAANEYMNSHVGSHGSGSLWIEHRAGEDTKCEGYCDVRRWCPYYQAKVNEEF